MATVASSMTAVRECWSHAFRAERTAADVPDDDLLAQVGMGFGLMPERERTLAHTDIYSFGRLGTPQTVASSLGVSTPLFICNTASGDELPETAFLP